MIFPGERIVKQYKNQNNLPEKSQQNFARTDAIFQETYLQEQIICIKNIFGVLLSKNIGDLIGENQDHFSL